MEEITDLDALIKQFTEFLYIVDDVIKWYILRHPDDYLEETNLREFVNSVSQFGTDYVQYCFCTEKALQELIKD